MPSKPTREGPIFLDIVKYIKKPGTMSASINMFVFRVLFQDVTRRFQSWCWVPMAHRQSISTYFHLLIPCLHQSCVTTHQFFSWCPATSLSHWIIYPAFLLLHHSFTAPLLSNHSLICQSERCFLRSARGKTSASDGSRWGLLHVVLSPVREQGRVG